MRTVPRPARDLARRRPARLRSCLLVVGLGLGTGLGAVPTAAGAPRPATDAPVTTSAFRTVGPTRLLDTRVTARMEAGETIELPIAEPGSTAPVAVALSIVAVDAGAPGFLTAWGDGPRPTTSVLNVDQVGQTRANFAIVPLGADGSIRIYSLMATDVVVDETGAFFAADSATSGRFVPLPATRLVDTRVGHGAALPAFGGGFAPGAKRKLDLSSAGVPADAMAAVVSITGLGDHGWWSAWAAAQPWPGTSNVNVGEDGAPATSTAFVPISNVGGKPMIAITANAGGHVVVDVAGYITGANAAADTAGLFVPITPTRVADTRGDPGPVGRLGAGSTLGVSAFPFASGGAAAVAANLTVTAPAAAGFVTAFPRATARPAVATATYLAGQTLATGALTALSSDGLSIFTLAPTDVVVDVTGWFTGTPTAPTGPPDEPAPTTTPDSVPSSTPPSTTPATTPGTTTATTTATTQPPSASTSYDLMYKVGAGYARYDPCMVLTVHGNYASAPANARAQLVAVVAQIKAATGLNIAVGADTALRSGPSTFTTRDINVFWSTPAQNSLFQPDAHGAGVVGQGGSWYTQYPVPELLGGSVELAAVSYVSGDVLTDVLLHELGHVVGLGHVPDNKQVMYPTVNGKITYQPGDLAGLARLGSGQGCIPRSGSKTGFDHVPTQVLWMADD